MIDDLINWALDEMDDLHFIVFGTAIALAYELRIYIPLIAVGAYAYITAA